MKQHETCKCKYRLNARVCNNKQRWNDDKCKYKCKELIEKVICEKRFIWNPSNCECQCGKSCNIGDYLDYANCECRKKLVGKLVEEYTENIVEVKIAGTALFERRMSVYLCIQFMLS